MAHHGDQRVKVTFDTIDTAASDIITTATHLRDQLDALRQYIHPLVASWSGEAATNYQNLQNQWHTSADQLHQILGQIATTLSTVNHNYVAVEKKVANLYIS
jgi:early secretory antigenic target protein ESAT-6